MLAADLEVSCPLVKRLAARPRPTRCHRLVAWCRTGPAPEVVKAKIRHPGRQVLQRQVVDFLVRAVVILVVMAAVLRRLALSGSIVVTCGPVAQSHNAFAIVRR